jgi:hypothetical protein
MKMKANNPLDEHLKVSQGKIPEDILNATIYVNDTLYIAWLSAQSIFEDKATPEIALAIYDRLLQRLND